MSDRDHEAIQYRHAERLESALFDMCVDHPAPKHILEALDRLGLVLVSKIVEPDIEPSPDVAEVLKEAFDMVRELVAAQTRKHQYEAAVKFIAEYEAEHGAITDDEMDEVLPDELCAVPTQEETLTGFRGFRCGRTKGHDGDHAESEFLHDHSSGHPWNTSPTMNQPTNQDTP